MKKNNYEILGVKYDSSIKNIKERYALLKKKYGSKEHSSNKETKKWKDIKNAYLVLSKQETRKAYDESLAYSTETAVVNEPVIINVEEKNVENGDVKSYFLPRMLAYLIDIILIWVVASFIFQMFPQSNNLMKLNDQFMELQQSYLEQKVTPEQYIAQNFDLSYDMAYQNVIYVIINVTLGVSYFVIFQYQRRGQTLGKQLLHIRVVSNEPGIKLSMNNYLYRALILQAIALNIISVIAVLTLGKNGYGSFIFGLNVVQGIIIMASIMMILFRRDGRGIHDMISGTKVVMDGNKEKILCEN